MKPVSKAFLFTLIVLAFLINAPYAYCWYNIELKADPQVMLPNSTSKITATVTLEDGSSVPDADVTFSIYSGQGGRLNKVSPTKAIFIAPSTPGYTIIQGKVFDPREDVNEWVYDYVTVWVVNVEIKGPKSILLNDVATFTAIIFPPVPGEYQWQITQGSDKTQIIGSSANQTITVKGTKTSNRVDDITLSLRFKPQSQDRWTTPVLHKFSVVVKVEILNPQEGGKVTITPNSKIVATGQLLPEDTGEKLHWETTIEKKKFEADSFSNTNPQLVNITMTFPEKNDSWGNNTLKAIFPESSLFSDTNIVKYFYPLTDTQKNPINWYYYWEQTSANYGAHTYDQNIVSPIYGETRWDAATHKWKAYIGKDVINYTGQYGGVNGIDHFANTCRHEAQHIIDCTSWWPNGHVPSLDKDDDIVPDNLEQSLGYDPAKQDTDGDGYVDAEDHAYDNQPAWSKGSADIVDWANPGHQYP